VLGGGLLQEYKIMSSFGRTSIIFVLSTSCTLAANDENDPDTTKRLFHGLLEGEALRWYNGLLPAVKSNWDQLVRAFTTEFRDVGTDSRVLRKLGEVTMDPSDTLQSYSQKVQVLISKLANPAPANLQLEVSLVIQTMEGKEEKEEGHFCCLRGEQ
jgi:hypothetical protein